MRVRLIIQHSAYWKYNCPESESTERQCCINTCESSTFLIIVFIPPQYDAVVIFFMANENKKKVFWSGSSTKIQTSYPGNHYSKTTFGQCCMPSSIVQTCHNEGKKDRVDFSRHIKQIHWNRKTSV